MSRRVSQAPVSVEALLPSLGALSVNNATPPKQLPIAAGEKKKQKKDEGDDVESGPRLGQLPTDPATSQPVKWVKEDGKLDQDALKRIVYAQNKEWIRYYPPPGELKKPEEYGFKDWTSFFPEGANLYIKDPHWLRAAPSYVIWPASKNKHSTLAEARMAFLDILQDSLAPLKQPTDKSTVEQRSKLEADISNREDALQQLQQIIEADANKTDAKDLSNSRSLIALMFRQDAVFGQYKRKKTTFPLPPGWMTMYKHRSVLSMENQLARRKGTKEEGKPGAFSDPSSLGPQYATWSEQDPGTNAHRAYIQDSPVQAWLVYLMYQASSKTFDPREMARRKDATEEARKLAAANAAKRKEQVAQREVKLEEEREQRKRAVQDERDAALEAEEEASRKAAESDMPAGDGGEQAERDLLAALDDEGEGDGPADAPVPAEGNGEESDDDETMRELMDLIN